MTKKLLEQGRKYALTSVFLFLATAVMVASFVLGLSGKLTAEWVNLCTIYLPAISIATVGFQASNAYITAKTPTPNGGGQ